MSEIRCKPIGLSPSFGFGDRLGLATAGHVAALRHNGTGILPIFAQQSIREMTRTRRTAQQVIDDAMRGAISADYTGPMGADADHLKTPEDIDTTAAAGFCFFTLDPSGQVDGQAGIYDSALLEQKFKEVPSEAARWLDRYKGKSIRLSTGTIIEFDKLTVMRAAVKYGRAIELAVSLARHVDCVMSRDKRPYEIELSVDETPEPTTAAEHYIVADQCRQAGVKLISLAPRFVGDFEKGVDFKGDICAFQQSLNDHAAIAELLGPYKLSLHSGSDKLSIYPRLSKAAKGRFHVKTAGTSYLEALRAISRHDPSFFRHIVNFSRKHYETDRATYHVSAELATTPPPEQIRDERKLVQVYLDDWSIVPEGRGMTAPGRQILHTTFGSVLTDPTIRPQFFSILKERPETYSAVLDEHFSRHLAALSKAMQ
ncbi:MAG TPA: tagaturonate epimerase family protein [Tepidisphaeraceae bacterium]|nr:tagaturonate epimerase family protein [Tepidisphaeraceae bacterium]